MVQGIQKFRQVRAASCVILYVLCGCIVLGVDDCLEGVPAAIIYPGGTGLYGKS